MRPTNFGAEVTALNGTAADDAYTSPTVAIDGNNKLWVGAVWDVSNDLIDDKVLALARSTNAATGDLTAFGTTTRLGKPDQNRRSVALMAKGAGEGMYLLSGESSKNLEVWEWEGATWQIRNTGGDYSWFGMAASTITSTVRAFAISGGDIYLGGDFTGRVSRWDGSSWSTLGSGLNNTVYALAVLGSDLYVGGGFYRCRRRAGGGLCGKMERQLLECAPLGVR